MTHNLTLDDRVMDDVPAHDGSPSTRELDTTAAKANGGPPPTDREQRVPRENQVHLTGRISGFGEPRVLPSGDRLVPWRLVVPRRDGHKGSVDVIDIACWTPELGRAAESAGVGAHVRVSGELHRRFFHANGGLASRYEIEAATLEVLTLDSDASPAEVQPDPGPRTDG